MRLALAAMWGLLGALALPIGAWLALRYRLARRTLGLIMGFGAGALLAAIAYELIPPDTVQESGTFLAFGIGAVVFFALDRMLARGTGSGEAGRSIALGALLDGIPESLVLGMGLAGGGSVSVAFFAAVVLSNLPESLGATADLRRANTSPRRVYLIWWSIVAVSALAAGLGYGLLALLPSSDGHKVRAFAAGAVLTMLADSMMPEAYRDGGKLTGLATALGFAVAAGLSIVE